MTPTTLIEALALPVAAQVKQRVPKKLLLENGANTATDRRLINESIEEIHWVAALKPNTIGVAAYRDDCRDYLEIAVLTMTLRTDTSSPPQVVRICELVHRAIPYPVVLALSDGTHVCMSLAHIRWAQREAEKTVLDGEHLFAVVSAIHGTESCTQFLAALPLDKQPSIDLHALYQGWMDTLSAWQAATVTGRFISSQTPAHAAERRAALHRCLELDAQIAKLRISANKETQIALQVAANLEIKALLAERQRISISV